MNPRPDPAGQAQLAGYLAEIAGALPGSRRRREPILAELGDGLDQSVADRVSAGQPPDRAVAAAIEEFGSPHAVAEALATELAIGYARRTIAWFIGTGPLVGIWWLLVLRPDPWRGGLLALLVAIPVIPLAGLAVATAAGAIATTGRLMRWLPESGPRRALGAAVAVAALALSADFVVITTYLWRYLPVQPLAALAVAASLIRVGCSLLAVRHAAQQRRRLAPATPSTTATPPLPGIGPHRTF